MQNPVFQGSQQNFILICSIATLFLANTALADNGPSLVFHVTTPAPAKNVYVATDKNGWNSQDPAWKMREVAPCTYLLTKPPTDGLLYRFVIDGEWQPDPENPLRAYTSNGTENSVFINESMRQDPALELQKGVRTWNRSTLTLPDQNGVGREITVLTPPAGFQKRSSVTVYFQDGVDYLNQANASNVIANLSSEPGMPAITAVFIPPGARHDEYGYTDQLGPLAENYARFIAESVVPAVEQKYGIQDKASNRLIIGPSAGGLISLFTGLKYSNVFGNIASQSASVWMAPEKIHDLMQTVSESQTKPRLFLEWGSLENWGITDFNPAAVNDAKSLGIPVKSRTIPALHNWDGWKNGLSGILRAFFHTR